MSREQQVLVEERLERRFGDELYGVYDLLDAGNDEIAVEIVIQKIFDQESGHIAEGVRLRQRQSRKFAFDGAHVLDPYESKPMVDLSWRGLETATHDPDLTRRSEHEVAAEQAADDLMRYGEVGDGFWRVSPYGHEWADERARAHGMWPEYLRSYLYLYRKVDEATLEVTTVTIDQSDLGAYRSLLFERGADVPRGMSSHEIPGIRIRTVGLSRESNRDSYIDKLLDDYARMRPNFAATDGFFAEEFLHENQAAIQKIVQLNSELASSLRASSLTDYAREALDEAWSLTTELGLIDERYTLEELARSPSLHLVEHDAALRLLLNIQRFGVWQYLRLRLDGLADEYELDQHDIQTYALQAALAGGVMPGCSGGFGLEAMFASIWGAGEGWHGGSVHIGTCVGPCQTGPKPVGVKNWCHECIKGHCN